MSINKVITPMTELSDPPSYMCSSSLVNVWLISELETVVTLVGSVISCVNIPYLRLHLKGLC